MSRLKSRARYILLDNDRQWLLAVYDVGVKLGGLKSISQRLNSIPGIQSGVMRRLIAPYGSMATIVWVGFSNATGQAQGKALALFKELTRPELPIAIGELCIELLVCDCGYLDSRLVNLRFLTGFEPKDDEAFVLRYYAAIKPLPIAHLLEKDLRLPYPHVMAALEKALASVGASATVIRVQPRDNYRPCNHPQ